MPPPMKRQESLRSSSFRRSTPSRTNTDHNHNSHHVKSNVGCMAGILQLVQSKYHTRRKFLTFGKKQNKQAVSNSSPQSPASRKTEAPVPPPPQPPKSAKPVAKTTTPPTPAQNRKDAVNVKLAANKSDKSQCKSPCSAQLIVQQSSPIPADINLSRSKISKDNGHLTPDHNRRSPPALVARLMGLDDTPTSSCPPSPSSSLPNQPSCPPSSSSSSMPNQPSPASEKRRKLLGALEKCDEDLKTLKKVIEAMRSESRTPKEDKVVVKEVVVENSGGKKLWNDDNKLCSLARDGNDREVPAVVKVQVDDGFSKKGSGGISCGGNQEEQSPVSVLENHNFSPSSPPSSGSSDCYNRNIRNRKGEVLLQHHQGRQEHQHITMKGEGSDIIGRHRYHNKQIDIQPLRSEPTNMNRIPVFPPWSSEAMIETVDEVCKDISWGQKREIGIIGLLIQDGIYRDLIDEIIRDLGGRRRLYPSESYKRKLCF